MIPRFLLTLLLVPSIFIGFAQSEHIGSTKYYEFKSNLWVNLHHFIYEKATDAQKRKLKEDGFELSWDEEKELVEEFNDKDLEAYQALVDYYRRSFGKKDMRTELQGITIYLSKQTDGLLPVDTLLSDSLVKLFNGFFPVYKSKIWPLHDFNNRDLVNTYIQYIKEAEEGMIADMERVAGNEWPDSKVRVDIMTYASWSGAYSLISPRMNLYLSALDPLNAGTTFVETVFHESSHILFSRSSDFRSRIYYRAKELEIDFPRGLWHASLFYLCGIASRDYLETKGLRHKLSMDVKNIFSRFSNAEFRRILDDYYYERKTMEETVDLLLMNLK